MLKIKNLFIYIFSFLAIFSFFHVEKIKAEPIINKVTIHLFSDYENPKCANCKKMDLFFNDLLVNDENIELIKHYIAPDATPNERTLFEKVRTTFETPAAEAPAVVIGGKFFAGYNTINKSLINKYIEVYKENPWTVDIVELLMNDQEILPEHFDLTEDDMQELPFLGVVDVKKVSIGLIAVVLGFVDGFNPCAMGVLIFLIGMLINSKDRKRMWILGVTFLLASAAFYFLILVSWMGVLNIFISQTWFQIIIGLIAITFGSYNIYKYFKSLKTDDGCEVIDEKKRKKMFTKIKDIVLTHKYPLAIVGIVSLAVVVNLVEIACSTGFPLIFTQILALNNIVGVRSLLYIFIYIFFFLIDDLIVFGIAMGTMKVVGMSNKFTKYSHLIGGLLMLLIGILMIFFPDIINFNF